MENKNEQKNLRAFYQRNVVVKFLNPEFSGDFRDGKEIISTSGVLSDFAEDEEDDDGKFSGGYIVVQTDTDYDRISLKNIIKIYVKE